MEEIKKNSNDWYYEIYPEGNLVIYDPDGWDRTNYHYSFYEELITKEEFEKRLSYSTVLKNKKYENKNII
jgi:hypothetical protein